MKTISFYCYSCIHRGVRKRELDGGVTERSVGGDDEGLGGVPGGGGRVGLYLFGWGVGGVVVGLSGAVHPPGYATPTLCSPTPGPAVLLFILTRALMVIILHTLYLQKAGILYF